MTSKRFWIKDPFCGLSHFVGALLSVVDLVVLLILAHGRLWHTIAFAIYGSSLILLYTASTLYHSLHVTPRHQQRLQRLDHLAIFLLIAGTYTPVCLVTLHGAWGWSLLCTIYGIAALGMATLLFWKKAPDWVRVVFYIGIGWVAVIALPVLVAVLPAAALGWLIAGGVVYTVGCVIFALDRPHLWPGKFAAHDLWHLFVLAGSACHFILILRFIA